MVFSTLSVNKHADNSLYIDYNDSRVPGFSMVQHTTTTGGGRERNKEVSDLMKWRLSQRLLLEELLQDGDDAAGLWVVAVLRPGVLQQHVSVSAGLQELVAAEQGVVTHLRLPHEALQAVHVLDGLRRVEGRDEDAERQTAENRLQELRGQPVRKGSVSTRLQFKVLQNLPQQEGVAALGAV